MELRFKLKSDACSKFTSMNFKVLFQGFNVPEETIRTADGDLVGLGMLGKANLIGGAIRVHQKPNKRKLEKINRSNP